MSDFSLTPSAAGSKCEPNAVAKSCQFPFYVTQSQMKGPLPNGQACWGGGQRYFGAKYQPKISDHELHQICREYPLISILFSWFLRFF